MLMCYRLDTRLWYPPGAQALTLENGQEYYVVNLSGLPWNVSGFWTQLEVRDGAFLDRKMRNAWNSLKSRWLSWAARCRTRRGESGEVGGLSHRRAQRCTQRRQGPPGPSKHAAAAVDVAQVQAAHAGHTDEAASPAVGTTTERLPHDSPPSLHLITIQTFHINWSLQTSTCLSTVINWHQLTCREN